MFSNPRVPGVPGQAPSHLPLGLLSPLTAGWAGAVHRGDPEIGGASVEDDSEVLWWGANGDGAKVFYLQGGREGRRAWVEGWGPPRDQGRVYRARAQGTVDWRLQSLGGGKAGK